jgi:hypothetical protein
MGNPPAMASYGLNMSPKINHHPTQQRGEVEPREK